MGLFKKDKNNNIPETDNINKKADIPDAVRKALLDVLPLTAGDIDAFPEAYPTPKILSEQLENASVDDLLILSDYFFNYSNEIKKTDEQKAQVYAGATSVFYGRIQIHLQNASEIFVIMDNSLKNPMPYIADGEALLFFKNERASQWCSFLNSSLTKPLTVVQVKKDDIQKLFVILTVNGVEYIRFHPEINNIHARLKDMFKCDVKTVSDSRVRFLMLNYIQLLNTKKEEQKKASYNAMLGTIAGNKFLVPGIEEGNNFRATTIGDTEKKVWLPIFTDIGEFQMFIQTVPALKDSFKDAVLKTAPFAALKGFLGTEGLSGIVVNPADAGIRMQSDLCEKMIESVEKAKEENKTN